MALPFLLKYEAEKGRIALAAMIGGIVFVVIFFFKMFETAGIELIDIVMNQMYLKKYYTMGFYLYNFHCHLVPVIENS